LIAKAKDFEKLINSCIKNTKREREREREMFGLVHLVLIVKLQQFPRHNLCVMGRLVQILGRTHSLTPGGGLGTPGASGVRVDHRDCALTIYIYIHTYIYIIYLSLYVYIYVYLHVYGFLIRDFTPFNGVL
jgi:hypothetical protein